MNVRNLTLWVLVIAALAAAGCGGSDSSNGSNASSSSPADSAQTAAQAKADAQKQAAAEAAKRFDAAEQAVQDGDFKQALKTAARNGADDRNRIRRKISRTLAAEATTLVQQGHLAAARTRLNQAGRYGSTPQISDARDSYREAQRRAEARRKAARKKALERKAAKELLARYQALAKQVQAGGTFDTAGVGSP